MLDFQIDASWAYGLVLAMTRVAAFVAASPLLPRTVPLPGRLAVVVVVAFFMAAPIGTVPGLFGLIVAAVVNAVVGVALGFLTGILFHLFAAAGSLVDLTSGFSVAALIDPSQGQQAAPFSRMFNLVALAVFFVIGGFGLVVRGLVGSVRAVPLDGELVATPALASSSVQLLGDLMAAAVELAMPVLAALFLTEIVLGIAARFAPQANIFILGLPVKMLLAMLIVSLCVLLIPGTVDGVLHHIGDQFVTTLNGLAGR